MLKGLRRTHFKRLHGFAHQPDRAQ